MKRRNWLSSFGGKCRKLLTIFRNQLVEILYNPLKIKATASFNYNGQLIRTNWGDDLNFFFLKEIVRKRIMLSNEPFLCGLRSKNNYLIIGSTLSMLTDRNTVVWGAGMIDSEEDIPVAPSKVLAVRGPLTRECLLKRGIACPEIYGDPALLLPYHYRPKKSGKRFKIGLIPHYVDLQDEHAKRLSLNEDVLLIDFKHYGQWHEVIDQICSCDCIASSSLHGLIIAEAYRIPNVWIKFSDRIRGGEFKFHDFFLSLKADRDVVEVKDATTLDELIQRCTSWRAAAFDPKPLIAVSPFPLDLTYFVDENN